MIMSWFEFDLRVEICISPKNILWIKVFRNFGTTHDIYNNIKNKTLKI